jgi:hypothetical protein
MTITHPFCRELFQWMVGILQDLPHPTHKRLVVFVLGILLAKSIVLSRIASAQTSFCGGSTLVESHERHLRRIENDPLLTQQATYHPAARRVLEWKRAKRLLILIDETGHTDFVRVLMAAIWYRGRAVPLAWVQWRAQHPLAISYWVMLDRLLAMVASIVPTDVKVVVIGDRAFGNPQFTDRVEAYGWDWLVRIQSQTCFRDRQGRLLRANQVLSQPGGRWKRRGQVFKKRGWRPASLVAFWDHHHREPLLLASSLPPNWELIQLYLCRGAIECLFRDWKSSGWQWESSQVRDLEHSEHLLLGMAWATLAVLCLGDQAAQETLAKPPRPRRTLPREGKRSLFTLGRERLQGRLYNTIQIPTQWELGEFDAPGWEQQVYNHHARAYVFAQPKTQVA